MILNVVTIILKTQHTIRWTEKRSPQNHVHIIRYFCLDPKNKSTNKGDQRIFRQPVHNSY